MMNFRETIKNLVLKNQEALIALNLSCQKTDYTLDLVEQQIGEEFDYFRSVSLELINKIEDQVHESTALCPCGSELIVDREVDEESACGLCKPSEISYERDYDQPRI